MEKGAVTAVCWVPRGKCSAHPRGEDGDDTDIREAAAQLGAASASSEGAAGTSTSIAGLEEFDMDKYDDDSDDGGLQFFSVLRADGELAREKDPYLQGNPDSDSDSEESCAIRQDDNVFIATSCEEDNCVLELYVFDEDEASMYVNHDIMLGAYPLCVDWFSTASVGEGNFAAVGSIDHSIHIWNLDLLDPLEPSQTLGAPSRKEKRVKGKRRKPPARGPTAHDGPVLCLHGSMFNRSVLASGSGDHTLKVWDVSGNTCVHTYSHHTDKVQCVKWHPSEQAVMLSAAFDRHLALLDVRQPGQAAMAELPAEAENAIWSRHKPFECLVSVDNGGVACYDVRKVASKAPADERVLWSLQAHDVACTAVQDVPAANVLVTAGLDGNAKVWNCGSSMPTMVLCKNLQAGPLFTCHSQPESPALVCFGGRCPVMWDLSSEQLLVDVFNL